MNQLWFSTCGVIQARLGDQHLQYRLLFVTVAIIKNIQSQVLLRWSWVTPNMNKECCKTPLHLFTCNINRAVWCFTDYQNFCSFDVSCGKMRLGAALVAETAFKERSFKERLLYQGNFSLGFCRAVLASLCVRSKPCKNIPNNIPVWIREGSRDCQCELSRWVWNEIQASTYISNPRWRNSTCHYTTPGIVSELNSLTRVWSSV